MLATLSILVSVSLAGFLFCLIKLIKINKMKKTNIAEPIANKKWRKVLVYAIIICGSFFILAISLFFSVFS